MISEHFQEDYFSFTGLVDVKCPPQQSLLERFLDEAAGMAPHANPHMDPDGYNTMQNLYSDDDDNKIFRFPKVPDAGQCSAFGPGLELGQVQAKNNFQVSYIN